MSTTPTMFAPQAAVKYAPKYIGPPASRAGAGVSADLSSRTVSSQVLSALCSLTSVFGMGTGGPCTILALTMVHLQGLEPWTH